VGARGARPGVSPALQPGIRTQNATLRQKLRYRFDNTMSRGTPALVGWLGVLTLLLVAAFTLVVLIGRLAPQDGNGQRPGLIGQGFKTMVHALDPGTIGGDSGKWPFLLAMFGITVAGLFVVSALIGVIATGLDNRIEGLRKGRSLVIEDDHTLILGWSETVFTILSELTLANESEEDPVVVILSELDRVEMEDQIRAKVGNTANTRVVCRTGSVIDLADLAVVNPQGARSIIVLSPTDDEPDVQVIKTVLALTRGPARREHPYHIVAEIEEPANMEAARLVGGDETVLIDKSETISRLIVQTSRQSGLAAAYTDLLDFEGAEIYFREDPALAGKTFRDAIHAYENCTVIGVRAATGEVRLNPAGDSEIAAGDQVIAIAEDDADLHAAVAQSPNGNVDQAAIVEGVPYEPKPQRSLILGWNKRAARVINELDEYVMPGSSVKVVATWEGAAKVIESECAELDNMTVEFHRGDTTKRRVLESLEPHTYDHVIVLCYSDLLPIQRADARTLVTLLHLRDMIDRGGQQFTITSEMLDDRNRELAEVTKVDDVIVSDKLISLLVTQISQNDHLTAVFDELFTAEGSELYMRPAGDYVKLGQPTSFRTLVESASRRNEVAIGYRLASENGGVVVNPSKSEELVLAETDRIVVLAED
jgi:voltage-gated potassium channel Kch